MSIVQDSTSNLIGGVSQQTDKLMFPNQVKEMVNFYPKPIDGLKRRPSSDYIKKLFTNSLSHSNFLCQPVFKDNEEYYIILDGATIRVFDFNGNSKTINGSTLSYEVAYTSTENIKLITIPILQAFLSKIHISSEFNSKLVPGRSVIIHIEAPIAI